MKNPHRVKKVELHRFDALIRDVAPGQEGRPYLPASDGYTTWINHVMISKFPPEVGISD